MVVEGEIGGVNDPCPRKSLSNAMNIRTFSTFVQFF